MRGKTRDNSGINANIVPSGARIPWRRRRNRRRNIFRCALFNHARRHRNESRRRLPREHGGLRHDSAGLFLWNAGAVSATLFARAANARFFIAISNLKVHAVGESALRGKRNRSGHGSGRNRGLHFTVRPCRRDRGFIIIK